MAKTVILFLMTTLSVILAASAQSYFDDGGTDSGDSDDYKLDDFNNFITERRVRKPILEGLAKRNTDDLKKVPKPILEGIVKRNTNDFKKGPKPILDGLAKRNTDDFNNFIAGRKVRAPMLGDIMGKRSVNYKMDDFNNFITGRKVRAPMLGDIMGKRSVNCRRLSNGGSRCVNPNGSVYYLGSGPVAPARE